MRHFIAFILGTLLAVESAAQPGWVPPPLDRDAFALERYWQWLKTETGAPEDIRWPDITIEPLPRTVRMAVLFPIAPGDSRDLRIAISPQTIDRAASGERLVVIGELAHEIAHYMLVLSENGWDVHRRVFVNDVAHHCQAEFQRLNRQMAVILWDIYHSSDTSRSIERMIRLACWRDGRAMPRR